MIILGFRGEISTDHDALKRASRDASLFQVMPRMVVFPKDTDDIKTLVRFVNNNRALGFSLTARAAGTDMTGGPLTESIVVDVTRHMNRVKEVGVNHVVVEPGLYYRNLEKALFKKDLLLPSYPASKNLCAVGGMVANNSGGEKTLSYGKTEKYVKRLKVVLHDGNEYTFQPLHPFELKKKLRLTNAEGDLYRDVYHLIRENEKAIQAARPLVSKNSAGYALWNVWDGQKLDLTKLIIGSQGTLGIITEITFKVIRPKHHSRLLVMFLNDLKPLARIVRAILTHSPESFESYDNHTFSLGIKYLFWRFAWQFIPELFMILWNGRIPKMVLIAEFTGNSEREVTHKIKAAQYGLQLFNIPTRITKTKEDAEKYWAVRRESFNLLRTKIKDRQAAPFIDDIVVRPEALSEFLPKLNALLKPYERDMTYTIAGHAGDGNFHIIPLMDLKNARVRHIIPKLSREVYELVMEYHGSITGEHNDGLIRTPYLERMYGNKIYGLFKQIKRIFDPHTIFNPGKKVPDTKVEAGGGTLEYAMKHIRKV